MKTIVCIIAVLVAVIVNAGPVTNNATASGKFSKVVVYRCEVKKSGKVCAGTLQVVNSVGAGPWLHRCEVCGLKTNLPVQYPVLLRK